MLGLVDFAIARPRPSSAGAVPVVSCVAALDNRRASTLVFTVARCGHTCDAFPDSPRDPVGVFDECERLGSRLRSRPLLPLVVRGLSQGVAFVVLTVRRIDDVNATVDGIAADAETTGVGPWFNCCARRQ